MSDVSALMGRLRVSLVPTKHTRPLLATQHFGWQEAGAQGLMALSCYLTMVFSAVSQSEAIMMKGWLSTFARSARSASQFDSDTLTTPTLRTSVR